MLRQLKITNVPCFWGPNIARYDNMLDGNPKPISNSLAKYLADELPKELSLADVYNLPYVAHKFEVFSPQGNYARSHLGELIKDFYKPFYEKEALFPVYDALAKLPFRFIVNTAPDLLLKKAFEKDKPLVEFDYFNFRKPEHNQKLRLQSIDEVEDLSEHVPLIYNLFGTTENSESLVITESDQLEFMDKMLQGEATSNIPKDIAMFIKQSKYLLFMGFDFGQWHLRLLLYLLYNRFEQKERTFALQNPKNLNELTQSFYGSGFNVMFLEDEPLQFIEDCAKKCEERFVDSASVKEAKLFIMYHQNDEAERQLLENTIAMLRKNKVIGETWHEGKMKAGEEMDATIKEQLETADIIVFVVTNNFFISDKIYEQQMKLALERGARNEAVVIPILMRSSDWKKCPL